MAASTWILVHSPLVGPGTWTGVADVLRTDDPARRVIVPDLRPAIDGGTPFYPGLISTVVSMVADGGSSSTVAPLVLVGHSRAGPILPAMAAAIGGRTEILLVDSRLPKPGHSWFEAAPPPLADRLREMAVGGLFPPWHEWFGPDALMTLVKDPQTRARFVAEIPRLPIAFFQEPLPETTWHGPSGYLQLSTPYADTAAEARALGWPIAELQSDHLAPLTCPESVADALLALAEMVIRRR
jgi:hypothetical protein